MTLLLFSDGGLERCACLLMADALEQHGQRCITAGPPLHGHQPLATPAPQLSIDLEQLAVHPLLDQVSAIGLFLQNPEQVRYFIKRYRGLCSARGLPAATLFSGPLVPLVGDALIRDLSLRLDCDVLLVSDEHQLRQLQSLTFNWPASLAVPTSVGNTAKVGAFDAAEAERASDLSTPPARPRVTASDALQEERALRFDAGIGPVR